MNLILCHVRCANGPAAKAIRRWCADHSGEFLDIPGTYIVDVQDVPMWDDKLAGSAAVERWAWLPWDVPAGLPEEVTKKETARRILALAFSKRVHRLDLLKLVEHAIDRLAGNNGKPKEFKAQALVDNLQAFHAAFDHRDAANDSELGMVTLRVEEVVNGFADDPAALRVNDVQRKAVVEKLRRLQRQLNEMTK